MVDDGFVDSLLFEIKQEIIENFFAERLRLQELRSVCQELAAEQRKRLRALRRSQARLRRLLLDEDGLHRFCALSGAEPEAFPPRTPPPEGPAILECDPRGLRLAARYDKLLRRAYEDLVAKAEVFAEGQAELEAATRAYNQDVEHYQCNYDVLTIVAVLNRMSPEEIERRHWLGENFRPEETASLADALTIRHLAVPEDLRQAAVALPDLSEMHSGLRDLAKNLCRRKPEEARTQLARYLLSK
jgi:hypothetical protein